MKEIFLCLLSPALLLAQETAWYRFRVGQILEYKLQLQGTTSYSYQRKTEEKSNLSISTHLLIIPEEVNQGIVCLRLETRRSLVKVGANILEDLSSSETQCSPLFGVLRLTMDNQGNITGSEQITPAAINLFQFLNLLPKFSSSSLNPGSSWKQSIGSLNFPGLPLGEFEFTYTYTGEKNGQAFIRLAAGQNIRKTKSEKDITVSLQGKNLAGGIFTFDRAAGELIKFTGNFSFSLQTVFHMPPGPEQKTAEELTLPVYTTGRFTLLLEKTSHLEKNGSLKRRGL